MKKTNQVGRNGNDTLLERLHTGRSVSDAHRRGSLKCAEV